jgi:hypothetical protein
MKKSLLVLCFGLAALVIACGPAAEDREAMHRRAKVFQDSIANIIRASMDEAAAPAPGAAPAVADTSVKMNPTNIVPIPENSLLDKQLKNK